MPNTFPNWRAAWFSLLDEADPNYPYHKPQLDQELFLDQHLGEGPVTMYYDEVLLDDGIDISVDGIDPIAELHTYKPALEESDIITVYPHVVWVNFSNSAHDGGAHGAFVKA